MYQHAARTNRLSGPFVRGATLLAVAGVVTLAAAGCRTTTGGTADPGAQPSSGPSDSGFLGAPDASPSASANGTGGTGGSGRPSPSASSSPRTSASAGPTVVYFRVKQKPECPKGTNQYPVAAVPLVIEWQVKGADQVTLAVDGPGKYNTYGAQASETFTFGCGGTPGRTETHTYTITAEHSGLKTTKSLTASAVVNEIPNV
jgi:hypothetical protein